MDLFGVPVDIDQLYNDFVTENKEWLKKKMGMGIKSPVPLDEPQPTQTPRPTAEPTPAPTNAPTKTPTPTPMKTYKSEGDLLASLEAAFSGRNNPPLATRSAHMAGEAMRLQEAGLEPRLAYGIGIKETGGLTYPPAQRKNNPYGIGPHKQFESIDAATKYFTDLILESPYYEDYRQSKDLYDLLKRYTPESDPNNPAMQKQINDLLQFLGEVK